MSTYLQTHIKFIKGVGPNRAEMLGNHLGIVTIADLLSHYPVRYEDRSKIHKVSELSDGISIQLAGNISFSGWEGEGRSKRLKAWFADDTGKVELVWFTGGKWIEEKVREGGRYILFGKPQIYRNSFSIAHPELEDAEKYVARGATGLVPIYPLTEQLRKRKIDSKTLSDIIRNALDMQEFSLPETLPYDILQKHHYVSKSEAIRELHVPTKTENLEKAQARLKYEEIFYLQLRHLILKKNNQTNYKGLIFNTIGDNFNTFFHHHIPFDLTGAQKRVVKEIREDMRTGVQMNRLLQGDVGSGKTMVAALAALIAMDNGFQTCIMAPTAILAAQHFQAFSEFLRGMGIRPVLLTGNTRKKERREIIEKLADGRIEILIGTHALLEHDVKYHNLGLVVIDEQHRFGVAQRAKLWEKGSEYVPHILVMTATPIPRTLALTVYGELDVSIIDEMPTGRKPIKTVHRYTEQRAFLMDFAKEQIALGRQMYVVFPLIEDSDKLNLQSLMSGYDMITQYLPTPEYTYSIVHGKMKPDEKEHQMQLFKQHKTQIMIATTVIEVGVNVPNASIMIIENADRFGLAQLHQLRGRVGRGTEQSFCILSTTHQLGKSARRRMKTMVESSDGFHIAQVDMELRGPGDMDGTKQSGILDLKLADLKTDEQLIVSTRKDVELLIDQDELLTQPKNIVVRNEMDKIPNRTVWSKIS
ncbi:MAG: ATP-dependent DNA helicase RecG [Bacteroidia bacterium]|nr:ATP-dependent DNA helicase RecG [Bacteroidia bacterium]